MLKITIFLLLALKTGTFCQEPPQDVGDITPEGIPPVTIPIESDDVPLPVIQETEDQKPAVKVGLTPEQIDQLADKILKIHGVDTNKDAPQDPKAVDRLKKVVARVEGNLENKLKEAAGKAITDNLIDEVRKEFVNVNLSEENIENNKDPSEFVGETQEATKDEVDEINNENADVTGTEDDPVKPVDNVLNDEDVAQNDNIETAPTVNEEVEELVEETDDLTQTESEDNQPEITNLGADDDGTDELVENDTEKNEPENTETVEEPIDTVQTEHDTTTDDQATVDAETENTDVANEDTDEGVEEVNEEETDDSDTISPTPTFEEAKVDEESDITRNKSPISDDADQTETETCNADEGDCDEGKTNLYTEDQNLIEEEELEGKTGNSYFDKILNFVF